MTVSKQSQDGTGVPILTLAAELCASALTVGSSAGYTMFRGSEKVLAIHFIYHFPLHFPSRASPCAITFQVESTIRGKAVTSVSMKFLFFCAKPSC
jgi:hypothetical protein